VLSRNTSLNKTIIIKIFDKFGSLWMENNIAAEAQLMFFTIDWLKNLCKYFCIRIRQINKKIK